MLLSKTKKVFVALLASTLFSNAAIAVESKDPIILTLHDWTGQLINTELMGRILENMGYNVKYQQADYIAQFAGLESGDLHIAMDVGDHRQAGDGSQPENRRDS